MLCELSGCFFPKATVSYSLDVNLTKFKTVRVLNIPPVMKMTFPERSGMSVSGLNFPPENILESGDF